MYQYITCTKYRVLPLNFVVHIGTTKLSRVKTKRRQKPNVQSSESFGILKASQWFTLYVMENTAFIPRVLIYCTYFHSI